MGAIFSSMKLGHRTSRAISAHLAKEWKEVSASQAVVLQRLKAAALTGFVVPYVELLPRDRYRFHFYFDGEEIDEGAPELRWIEDVNEEVDEGADTIPWMR